MNARRILDERLRPPEPGWLHAETTLRHFAIVTWAVPPERLAPHLPADRIEIPTWPVEGSPRALLGAVAFLNEGFRFPRIAPFLCPTARFRVLLPPRRAPAPGALGPRRASP